MTDTDEKMTWIGAPETVPCPPWCGGRHDEAHPVDRVHWSVESLAFEPVLADAEFERIGEETFEVPLRLLVTMTQGFRELGPRVTLAPESTVHGKGFAFTLTEAEKVARDLLRLVEEGRATLA
ncbi:DUF6907 domain-containing protein [Amycolatopsis sp. w19]|uniref:DUF6907 domain-containing protein n=1 Tax=Amycolatopsis sp. w19 TaxID=3448134 RepID=UPI003F1A8C4E